jgi:hypothetical protein
MDMCIFTFSVKSSLEIWWLFMGIWHPICWDSSHDVPSGGTFRYRSHSRFSSMIYHGQKHVSEPKLGDQLEMRIHMTDYDSNISKCHPDICECMLPKLWHTLAECSWCIVNLDHPKLRGISTWFETTITGEVDSLWIQIPNYGDGRSTLSAIWIRLDPYDFDTVTVQPQSYYGTELFLQISAEICRNGAIAHRSTTQIWCFFLHFFTK